MSPFNKDQLPEKVYLSGADCFHLVLDKHAKKHGAGGNVMRKVFYFEHSLQKEKIENILRSSPVIYWLWNIRLIPGSLFKTPYWRYTNTGNEISIQEHHSLVEKEVPGIILNREITVDSSHFIEADLVYYPSGGCSFILSWNHILLDAKGTTLLFAHLNHLSDNKEQDYDIFFPKKEKSSGITAYIRNMYLVKRFVQTSSKPPVSSVFNNKTAGGNRDALYKTVSFTAGETKKINENAFKTGARFGPTLFFIACCSQAINRLNKQRNAVADTWLPVPYDGRRKGTTGPLISNCVNFLFYRIPENILNDTRQTVKCISEQMSSQIKDRIPQRYTMFLDMMRHFPLWLYYFLISRTGKGVFASFLYTSAGDNFNELKTLFGEPVHHLTMIPALTLPPGLTFVFLNHNDKLNINIAYSSSVINNKELVLVEKEIKEILLGDH
jgi:hypothetical protein